MTLEGSLILSNWCELKEELKKQKQKLMNSSPTAQVV